MLEAAGEGAVVLTAAAGSGKTAVLVECLMRYLARSPGASLARTMVVTFTDKAAEEMRLRLAQELLAALSDPARRAMAETQLALLPRARVETFHAFGNRLIRRHGAALGLNPDVAVADAPAQHQLWQDAWQEAVAVCPTERALLAAHWDERGLPATQRATRRLLSFARSLPEPDAYLQRIGSEFADPFRIQQLIQILTTDLSAKARRWQEQLAELAGEGPESPKLALTIGGLDRALARLASGELAASPEEWLLPELPALSAEERRIWAAVAKIAGTAHETARAIQASALPDQLREEAGALRPVAAAVSRLSLAWLGAYQGLKRERRLIDYDDQLLLGYQILSAGDGPSQVARELASELDLLLVDEYQDTNQIQDAMLGRLMEAATPPPRLLAVGDRRQSIYRFRHALPDLLDTLAERMPGPVREMSLRENFRSRGEVLAAVEAVMADLPGIDGDARLLAGRDPSTYADSAPPVVEAWVIAKDGAEGAAAEEEGFAELERPEAEAAVIAATITRWCRQGEPVYDQISGRRPMQHSDVAVLVRSASALPAFQEVFARFGLATQVRGGERPGRSLEWQTMESLLLVAAGSFTEQDLASVLRSPMCGVGLGPLTEMVLAGGEGGLLEGVRQEAPELERRIRLWQSWAWLPVGELVSRLLAETGYPDLVLAMADAERRHNQLLAFADWADAYAQATAGGPQAFVEATRQGGGDTYHDRPPSGSGQAVLLMTIHQAKGLEWPVVVVAGAGVRLPLLSHAHEAPYLAIHRTLGIGLLAPDASRALRRLTPLSAGIETALAEEERKEEVRLLYVAMTRARDRLVVVGTVPDRAKAIGRWQEASGLSPASRWRAGRCYLDWLGPVALRRPELLPISWPHPAMPADESGALPADQVAWPDDAAEWDLWDERQPGGEPGPAEVVTATALAGQERAVELESQRLGVVALPRPGAAEPAAIGTATHLLFRHLDYTQVSEAAIRAQLERLVARRLLRPGEARHIDVAGLAGLFRTEWGRRLAAAPAQVQREVPFTWCQGTAGQGSLVHGQIDALWVSNGEVLVVDLKTDRIAAQDVRARAAEYRAQMGAYRRAMAELYPGHSLTVCLYFTAPGQAVIDPDLEPA